MCVFHSGNADCDLGEVGGTSRQLADETMLQWLHLEQEDCICLTEELEHFINMLRQKWIVF